MVTFVSQCEKNALPRTRRVLDAFANRIGDNTWQTVITQDGLNTVKKMLRQNASKSTAVSCHWIRSRARSQFLWVVGNRKKFNAEGYVAVNWTEKDLLASEYESDWKYLPVIKALTGMAALLHDWGKASLLFQNKLDPDVETKYKGDPIRHEWISCILFKAFIQTAKGLESDELWLKHLIDVGIDEKQFKPDELKQCNKPLADLPNAASLVAWLIVSHHRLPLPKQESDCRNQQDKSNQSLQELLARFTQQWGYENRFEDYDKLVAQCFEFPKGLLSSAEKWLVQVQLKAKDLLHHLPLIESAMADGSWRAVLHHARLCLMLGDHYYSSRDNDKTWQSESELFANTYRETKAFKQKLDEHLFNVARVATDSAKLLPYFESEPLAATALKSLQPQAGTPAKFKWQDKAVDKILAWREHTDDKSDGYFVVNMASTGCGKTIANAKVMQALSEDKQSLRYVLALGLRTLTLQTGDEYKERLNLHDSELAVLIGSKSVYELHQSGKEVAKDETESQQSESGSESEESLQEKSDELHWQGLLPEDELTTVLTNEKDRQLLHAPVLTCTIDHIMAATETKRGGRYILPCLRLMSSDLVIDEIDDFSGDDLIAIGRLVHLAAMLGRKVMISSATIPPDLALGLFNAYRQGWAIFAASRERSSQVNCVYIDEHKTDAAHTCLVDTGQAGIEQFKCFQTQFIARRIATLKKQAAKRKANIFPCIKGEESNEESLEQQYFEQVKHAILAKHGSHNTLDAVTQTRVSFGVVRVANIQPCVRLTQHLLLCDWPDDIEVRCMAYHSQQVLLLRHEQEKHLDQVLKRKEGKGEQPQAFAHSVIRKHLDDCKTKQLIFILVATPVEEVGRDHDLDWAVIEPSSYRSIIQMAGRVRRHREGEIEQPNIGLMQYNLKGFKGTESRVFNKPGFETDNATQLSTHDLTQLVDEEQLLKAVDAIPRIDREKTLTPAKSLADLEHFATERALGVNHINNALTDAEAENKPKRRRRGQAPSQAANVYWYQHLHGHISDYWWLTGLPQHFKRFRKSEPSVQLLLVKKDRSLSFCQRDDYGGINSVELTLHINHMPLPEHSTKRLWLERDYQALLVEYRQGQDSDQLTSLKFGEISFTDRGEHNEYEYNDQLGLVKVR